VLSICKLIYNFSIESAFSNPDFGFTKGWTYKNKDYKVSFTTEFNQREDGNVNPMKCILNVKLVLINILKHLKITDITGLTGL